MHTRSPSLYEKTPEQRSGFLSLVSNELNTYPIEKRNVLAEVVAYAKDKLVQDSFKRNISSSILSRYRVVDEILNKRKLAVIPFLKTTISALNTITEEQSSLRDNVLPMAQNSLDKLTDQDEKTLVISMAFLLAISVFVGRYEIAFFALLAIYFNDGIVKQRQSYATENSNSFIDVSKDRYGDSLESFFTMFGNSAGKLKGVIDKQLEGRPVPNPNNA